MKIWGMKMSQLQYISRIPIYLSCWLFCTLAKKWESFWFCQDLQNWTIWSLFSFPPNTGSQISCQNPPKYLIMKKYKELSINMHTSAQWVHYNNPNLNPCLIIAFCTHWNRLDLSLAFVAFCARQSYQNGHISLADYKTWLLCQQRFLHHNATEIPPSTELVKVDFFWEKNSSVLG